MQHVLVANMGHRKRKQNIYFFLPCHILLYCIFLCFCYVDKSKDQTVCNIGQYLSRGDGNL